MKLSYFLSLCILTSAASACTQGATAPVLKSSALAGNAPSTNASVTSDSNTTAVTQKPTAGLQKMTYQLGPFDLKAKTSSDAMQEKPARITFSVDEPMWLTGFVPKLVNAQGEALPGTLLHLAVISNRSENNPLCSAEHTGNPLMAATGALKEISLPEGYGYAVLPADTIEAVVVLQNPTDQDYHDVYFTFALDGQPMSSTPIMKDVLPLLFDADPCKHTPLAVEPGAYVKKTSRFAMPEAGSLIAAYGLLQAYGVEINLAKENDPAPFWKAAASIDPSYQVTDLPAYQDTKGVAVNSGDGVVMNVAYQNFSDQWFNDATAAAMVYIARSGERRAQASTTRTYGKKSADPATAVQATLLK